MILDINDVSFTYRSSDVLHDVSFAVKPGEVVSILGPNGVGKTTLLRCINAILAPKTGDILVGDDNILSLSRMEVARRIGYVAQQCEKARLTVFDAILLGRRPHMGWSVSDTDLKIVDSAIRMLELEDLTLRYTDEMSGGELQKVSIARALVQEPRLLLLDEPTSSLDLKNQIDILSTIQAVVKSHQVSAVMTMHDLNLAIRFSDRFILLKDGTIYEAGGHDIIRPDVIEEVYGLPVHVETVAGHPVVVPTETR
ncbi:ABC transporter ATP-binding protein [Methanogenium sp. MK-MG]|uniref:ABC transporter ATP-binding protein n=1 Tax=Methanogenium sp. MK-MG TaxID=2599926 RepID=UPI0013EC9E77|nr:ABC transporter ATP-binding protein [Methanogenium sp. MK-MG]KAF1076164.1 Cobalamin import ATP-binding protein BtuD [Methanogenium sp. MK-MG]